MLQSTLPEQHGLGVSMRLLGPAPLPNYIADRIDIAESGCWTYRGHIQRLGYARAFIRKPRKFWQAHRLVYTYLVGPIPEGLELDHLCRNRACCNPRHVEPVTHTENVRRGNRKNHGFCQKGHELTEQNTYWNPSGFVVCQICRRRNRITERAKLKARRQAGVLS